MKDQIMSKSSISVLGIFILTFSLLFSTGCGQGSDKNIKIPGVRGPNITMIEDNILISLVFEGIVIDAGARFPIPKWDFSYIEVSPDLQSGGTMMSVNVSLKDIFNDDLQLLDPQRLPGGRALPGVLSGELPAVAFTIEKWRNMSFYLGPKVFGIFFPINLGIEEAIATFRFYIGDKRMGNLSLVGNDLNGENGGFLLLLDLDAPTKKRLRRIANRYALH